MPCAGGPAWRGTRGDQAPPTRQRGAAIPCAAWGSRRGFAPAHRCRSGRRQSVRGGRPILVGHRPRPRPARRSAIAAEVAAELGLCASARVGSRAGGTRVGRVHCRGEDGSGRAAAGLGSAGRGRFRGDVERRGRWSCRCRTGGASARGHGARARVAGAAGAVAARWRDPRRGVRLGRAGGGDRAGHRRRGLRGPLGRKRRGRRRHMATPHIDAALQLGRLGRGACAPAHPPGVVGAGRSAYRRPASGVGRTRARAGRHATGAGGPRRGGGTARRFGRASLSAFHRSAHCQPRAWNLATGLASRRASRVGPAADPRQRPPFDRADETHGNGGRANAAHRRPVPTRLAGQGRRRGRDLTSKVAQHQAMRKREQHSRRAQLDQARSVAAGLGVEFLEVADAFLEAMLQEGPWQDLLPNLDALVDVAPAELAAQVPAGC